MSTSTVFYLFTGGIIYSPTTSPFFSSSLYVVVTVSLAEPVYSVAEGASARVCFQVVGFSDRAIAITVAARTLGDDTARGIAMICEAT